MNLKHTALLASLAALLLVSACRIGEGLPDVGEPCDASDDCEGALGCVPTSVENPAGPRVCMPPPDGWDDGRCEPYFLGDPDVICDCGCGAPDVDCPNETSAACNQDLGIHCPDGQNPVTDDNTRCE